jgi:DsbC/DsbD-like thiol-disulfide interchange protein
MTCRKFFLVITLMLLGVSITRSGYSTARAQTTPPKIGMKWALASSKVQRGRAVGGSLILDIPSGYHVNAHDPLSRFALPTKIAIEAPSGIKLGRIAYPKPIVRKFGFSDDRLGVYEKRTVIRFSIIVPPDQPKLNTEIKARVLYQSCSDEVCFPPVKQEVTLSFVVL